MRVGVMSATRPGRASLGWGRGAQELGELGGAVGEGVFSIGELVSLPRGAGPVHGPSTADGGIRG